MTSEHSHHVSTSCDKHRTLRSTQQRFQSVIQITATLRASEKRQVLAQIAHAIVLQEALIFHVRELFEIAVSSPDHCLRFQSCISQRPCRFGLFTARHCSKVE